MDDLKLAGGGAARRCPGVGQPRLPAAASGCRHRRARAPSGEAGVDFVSINIGMDMNPLAADHAGDRELPRAAARAQPDRFVAGRRTPATCCAPSRTDKLAVAFDLEGGVPLGERPEMVQLFYDLGVRQIHLAYNRNNAIGGGCYDELVPLTEYGRHVVAAVNDAGMLMDCSHTGHRTSLDIMARLGQTRDLLEPQQSTRAVFFFDRQQRHRRADPGLRRRPAASSAPTGSAAFSTIPAAAHLVDRPSHRLHGGQDGRRRIM